jgi:nitrogenase iron protein NifH
MRQIAIYGKGGIGKSTAASHLAYFFAEQGARVLQIGCSPKNDSTRSLMRGVFPHPILDTLREKDFDCEVIEPHEIIYESPLTFDSGGKIYCAESGGPEPGVGCGGKGVIEAIETLEKMDILKEYQINHVIYDVLGDVVCGGFSLPIRQGYAQETYPVMSGELEAVYQVCNVSKAIARFKTRSGAKLGGLIVNLRRVKNEMEIVTDFAKKLGTRIMGILPYSQTIKECVGSGKTVFEMVPDSKECRLYREIGEKIYHNKNLVIPTPMSFEELYEWWLGIIEK